MSSNLQNINDDNYIIYATKAYEVPCFSRGEFLSDVKLFDLVAKGLRNNIKSLQLLINYIVLIYNSFESATAFGLLLFKVDDNDHAGLKTLLWFLNRLPPNSILTNLTLDNKLLHRLKEEI